MTGNQGVSIMSSTFDHDMMNLALRLARKGQGYVEPNPMVGCVIVKNNKILGQGYHKKFGGPHAEVSALQDCTSAVRGATAYVTLEPCCTTGKTPPCTSALIQAKISRVVVATKDPNPKVKGRGILRLRRAGIAVDVGLCEQEARELIAPFATRMILQRPYVIAKWAQSLDGKLATHRGDSQWISCAASRRLVHKLRSRVDAIIVGCGTAIRDNPQLTAREVRVRRVARRVVLDGHLRIKASSQLVQSARQIPLTIFTTTAQINSKKAASLEKHGAQVVAGKSRGGLLQPSDILHKLYAMDATNVMIEGGAKVLSSFFTAGHVDEALIFTAPLIIGGEKAPAVWMEKGSPTIADALHPRLIKTSRSGCDVVHQLHFTDLSKHS